MQTCAPFSIDSRASFKLTRAHLKPTRDVLVTLIEAYENQHYAHDPTADQVEAIKFRMEQQGLTARDLEAYIGPSGRVSEVLNRKRPLDLRMVKQLHDGLRIPYESLLAGTRS